MGLRDSDNRKKSLMGNKKKDKDNIIDFEAYRVSKRARYIENGDLNLEYSEILLDVEENDEVLKALERYYNEKMQRVINIFLWQILFDSCL